MKENLKIINELYENLKKLEPFKQEDKARLDKKFRLEFNYNSNHLEGNTLTYKETELLLIFDGTEGNHTLREYEETKNHDVAIKLIEQLVIEHERPLSEQIIKELNKVILVRPFWKEALTPDGQNTHRQINIGNYKSYPNSVRLQNGEIFEYASVTDTPILMQELMVWYRENETKLHPVELATLFHYKFVRIHPFDDGNGRISRLLLNYVLLKNGFPPVIIKSADKTNYLRALHNADVGDLEPLMDYIEKEVIWSLKTAIKAGKGEDLEENDDFIKEIELIKRKASTKGTSKTPKVIFNILDKIDSTLLKQIWNSLHYFDSLFSDNTYYFSINDVDLNFKTNIPSSLDYESIFNDREETIEISNIIDSFKDSIDLYQKIKPSNYEDIQIAIFHHRLFKLKGIAEPVNADFMLEINFEEFSYFLKLKLNDLVIYQIEKSYKKFLLDAEIEDINKTLKKHLLDYIKQNIN